MIANGAFPTFLDVGAYVGDVGIRYANFFRTLGYPGKVFCFDPTLAGDLIPYNISLNGLERYVEHRSEAVSDFSGLVTFEQKQGLADSASALIGKGEEQNTIVSCVKLSHFIKERNIQSAFIKLDTENLEQRILADIHEFLTQTPSAVCFEFHAHHNDMLSTMTRLLETHYLFDVGYLPRPFCFIPLNGHILSQFDNVVVNYPYKYTDVLALSRNIPGVAHLADRLASLTTSEIEYSLVMEQHVHQSSFSVQRSV
jgi:FkbM family methyltransferase